MLKKILRAVWLALIFCNLAVSEALAGLEETLPTYHWVYEYIDQLWLRGFFQEFDTLNRPFTRGEIARALLELRKQQEKGNSAISKQSAWLISQLEKEFHAEIAELSENAFQTNAVIGGYFSQELRSEEQEFTDRARLRSRFSLEPIPNLTIFNSMTLDNRLDNNPQYLGKRQNGIAGFTEQAYLRLNWKRLNFLVGRDFVRWGAGVSATLLLSDGIRPMDMFKINFTAKRVRFTFFLAMLDAITYSDTLNGMLQNVKANRYLAAHRLDLKIASWLNLSFTELILFGGPERNLDFAYLNPFLFFHGNLLNGPNNGNTIGTIDWYLLPKKNFGFYGTFMIDDIQLEKSEVGDLEPNELGWLFGLRVAELVGLRGSNFLLEYTRINNRTFNTMQPYEKFLHRNFPIGHYLGNDFDRWHIQWNQWLRPDLEIVASYEQVRKGEGDIYASFDTPWRQSTLKEGYHEPFPTGVVEKTRNFNFRIIYHPIKQLRISLDSRFRNIQNVAHVTDANDRGWGIQFTLWFAPEIKFAMP